jgi:hypothetical protein
MTFVLLVVALLAVPGLVFLSFVRERGRDREGGKGERGERDEKGLRD